MEPTRTGVASWRRRGGPAQRSTRPARPCGSATSSYSIPELLARSMPRGSGPSSASRRSGSKSSSGLEAERRMPGAPTCQPSTCGSMPTTPRKDLLVLKIGGSVGAENDAALDAVVALNDAGHPLVVVHGGGPLVGEWAERMGMET